MESLHDYFEYPESKHRLDPQYEHDKKSFPEDEDRTPNETKEKIFGHLKALRDAGLVTPDPDYKEMYWSAMNRGYCTLTPLGQHYWRIKRKA